MSYNGMCRLDRAYPHMTKQRHVEQQQQVFRSKGDRGEVPSSHYSSSNTKIVYDSSTDDRDGRGAMTPVYSRNHGQQQQTQRNYPVEYYTPVQDCRGNDRRLDRMEEQLFQIKQMIREELPAIRQQSPYVPILTNNSPDQSLQNQIDHHPNQQQSLATNDGIKVVLQSRSNQDLLHEDASSQAHSSSENSSNSSETFLQDPTNSLLIQILIISGIVFLLLIALAVICAVAIGFSKLSDARQNTKQKYTVR